MLYHLAEYLDSLKETYPALSVFNAFTYITLRTILGALTALLISLLVGPAMIKKLSKYNIGQTVRADGPETHLTKAGTPTMGGALIIVSILIATLLWADLGNHRVWVVIFVLISFGLIGWVDDYKKLVKQDPKGLSAKQKIFWQSLAVPVGH